MKLSYKVIAAARSGGYLGDLTTKEARLLYDRGHATYVDSTSRWVLTGAGHEVARQIEAELTAAELAEIGGVR